MLTEHELSLIERLKGVGNYEVQEVLIDYMMAKLGESTSPPSAKWAPKVGDMVVLTDGVSCDHYEVVGASGCGTAFRLSYNGTLQDGFFDLESLAPAPMPDEPTADEMLDFLESDKRMMHWSVGQGWVVCGFGCGLPYRPTIREAIKLAMEVRK